MAELSVCIFLTRLSKLDIEAVEEFDVEACSRDELRSETRPDAKASKEVFEVCADFLCAKDNRWSAESDDSSEGNGMSEVDSLVNMQAR